MSNSSSGKEIITSARFELTPAGAPFSLPTAWATSGASFGEGRGIGTAAVLVSPSKLKSGVDCSEGCLA